MIRGVLYLLAAAAIWLGEGYVFSRFLNFAWWQTALMAILYAGLFVVAALHLARLSRRFRSAQDGMAAWRLISLAPMFVLVVGSFMSLPVLLLVAALGKLR